MKLSLQNAKILQELVKGNVVANSRAKSVVIERLVEEQIIFRRGRHHKKLHLIDEIGLENFLANQLGIKNLDEFVIAKENEKYSRADFVRITTDSKHSKERAFKGFLVNSLQPIPAKLNENQIEINPPQGSFQFISDF